MATHLEKQKMRQVEADVAIQTWKERKRDEKRQLASKQKALARKHAQEAQRINVRLETIRLRPTR